MPSGTAPRAPKASRNASSLNPRTRDATLNPISYLPRQERTKNICLPKRDVTDKQVISWFWHDDYRAEPLEGWQPPAEFRLYADLHGLDDDQQL